MEKDNVIYLPPPKELSQAQIDHWEQALETAERMRENALRILGRLPFEAGLQEIPDQPA